MTRREEGFSLVEVIIAMFLLAVIALAVLPLTIAATRVSVDNEELLAATAFANARLAPIRDAYPVNPITATTCTSLSGRTAVDIPDPAGTRLLADTTIGGCPSIYPGSVLVTVTVTEGSSTLVSLPTRVYVSAP